MPAMKCGMSLDRDLNASISLAHSLSVNSCGALWSGASICSRASVGCSG